MSKWRLYGVLVYDRGRLKLVEAVWEHGLVGLMGLYGDLTSGGYLLNGGRG